LCGSRKNPYPPHGHGRSLEIPWGRGDLKSQILEAKYEVKLEFFFGGGAKQKSFLWGVWIFFGTTH